MKAETVSYAKTGPAALPTGPDEITCTFMVLKSFRLQKSSGQRPIRRGEKGHRQKDQILQHDSGS